MNQNGIQSGVLKLSTEALREIDLRRGLMSRSNYVWHLLDSHAEGGSRPGRYVSQEEFREFQQQVKGLLRNFLDFVVMFNIERHDCSGRVVDQWLEDLVVPDQG